MTSPYWKIHLMYRDGRITAQQALMLMSFVEDLRRHRERRAFWNGVLDGIALGPVWRWLKRRRDFPRATVRT